MAGVIVTIMMLLITFIIVSMILLFIKRVSKSSKLLGWILTGGGSDLAFALFSYSTISKYKCGRIYGSNESPEENSGYPPN